MTGDEADAMAMPLILLVEEEARARGVAISSLPVASGMAPA